MGWQNSFQSCIGIWSEPSNWSPAGLPGANWVAIVDHDFSSVDILAIVETDSTVNSVDLLGSTGSMILEVLKGVTLTVIDGITVGSGATLKGKGAIVGDLINNAGTVTAGLPEPSGFLLELLGRLSFSLATQFFARYENNLAVDRCDGFSELCGEFQSAA